MKTKNLKRSRRVTGDALLYFLLHNMISLIFFFLLTVRVEVYEGKDVAITFLFTADFWDMVIFQVFLFLIISSVIGRITAFYIMKAYIRYGIKKSMKRWSEINVGINSFSIIVFLITGLITSIVYSLGIIAILQGNIFNETTLLTLVFTYVLFKTGVFFLVRWFIGAKT